MAAEIQVRTMMRVLRGGDPEVVISFVWIPRGSSNRSKVRALAAVFRRPHFKKVIKRVVVGTTRLTVHVRPCIEFYDVLDELKREEKEKLMDASQLKLFARQFA